MKNGRPSLVSRFAASTAVLAAALVILAIVFFVALHGDFFTSAIDSTLRGFSLSLAEHVWAEAEGSGEDRAMVSGIARRHRVGVVVSTPETSYAFDPDGQPFAPEQPLRPGWRFRRIEAAGQEGRDIVFYWDMVVFAHAHVPLLIALIVLLMLMIGATYAFQLAHLRPLAWLRNGVEAVARGDFKTRVPVVRRDEIGEVARAFNQMTRHVERMMNDRERLLGDVSHELRSPLTRVKVALELMPESAERQKMAQDVREMESLITLLLERERIRARSDRIATELVDLTEVTRESLAGFKDRPPGIVFEASDKPIEARADAALIGVVVHNLVDNALKFSLPDSRPVEVGWRDTGETVELEIRDDGRGVPEGERERVFEPFVKLDPARGHRVGYGLGLDLCKRIVEALGGTIEIGQRSPRGTRVRVSLPWYNSVVQPEYDEKRNA